MTLPTFPRLLIPAACLALVAACDDGPEDTVGEARQAEVAAPVPVLTQAAVPVAAADGTALVAGTWTVAEDALGARAFYAEEGLSPVLQLECPRGQTAVTLFIASSGLEPEPWRLDAGGEAARIDMLPTTEPARGQAAAINQSLPIITALGIQGETFAMTAPNGDRLQFPAHPGIRRVIDACNVMTAQGTP